MTDLLLRGGLVVDGSGADVRRADVLVVGDRVAAVGQVDSPAGIETLDVSDRLVCPGFVDIHTHSDLTVLSNPSALSKVHQGVTTEVVGNCGLGVAPLVPGADHEAIRRAVSYLDLDPDVSWGWRDTDGYLATVSRLGASVNVATLTGHVPLRAGVVGFDDRPATETELDQMCDLLAASFAAGSLGLSTGLVYAPACYATEPELLRLGQTVAEFDRVFTWHVRDYGDDLIASVSQAVRVAKRTGCRTQISHLAAVGRRNWGAVHRALELVDEASAEGARLGVDAYPYLHGNAPLAQLLPAWAQEGGPASMSRRLRDVPTRNRVKSEWVDLYLTWDEIVISWVPEADPAEALVGLTIAEIADTRGTTGDEVVLDLMVELGFAVLMVAGGRSEEDLRAVLAHPLTVVASDGLCLDPAGVTGAGSPHPRSYGCFPRFLSRYAGRSADALAWAVRQCTGGPAELMGITDRGVLRAGAAADIVVLSPEDLIDRATFAQPQLYPAGVDLVVVNGDVVVESGRHTGRRPGVVVRS